MRNMLSVQSKLIPSLQPTVNFNQNSAPGPTADYQNIGVSFYLQEKILPHYERQYICSVGEVKIQNFC
jgi:hypothetical protein